MTITEGFAVNETTRDAIQRLHDAWLVDGTIAHSDATYRYSVPSTGRELTAADLGTTDAQHALLSAATAQPLWEATPAMDRARMVRTLMEKIALHADVLANLIAVESAKPMRYAEAEVAFCLKVLETLLASVAESGSTTRADYMTGREVTTVLRPIGPSLLISPWNFPINLGVRKLATALLAGCVALWKPSELTPLSAVAIGELAAESGFPPGVIAVLPTNDSAGVVETLLASGVVRKLSFTGSTRVGRILMARAAEQMVRVSLELGGNGAAIVGAVDDIGATADAIVRAKFANNGQVCTTINRLLVLSSVHDALVEAIADRLAVTTVGSPLDPRVSIGPVVSDASAERIRGLVDTAVAGGATAQAFGEVLEESGRHIRPTIVTGVSNDDAIAQQEIFGPVLPVIRVDGTAEAIRLANDTPYGLSAYLFSDDVTELRSMLDGIRAGMVAVNSSSSSSVSSPFGGLGWSGFGRENGTRGLREFLDEVTYVY